MSREENAMPLPHSVGVVGGGRMGAGIAHAFLMTGSEVRVIEVKESDVALAHDRVMAAVRESAKRGLLSAAAEELAAQLQVTSSMSALRGCGLVVEAVPESLELKSRVFGSIEESVGTDVVIATNTSSLPVSELAGRLSDPGRSIGLHFFNPVPSSHLIEVVTANQTRGAVVSAAADWVRALGKTPIVVQDSPGFASSRLGLALGLEAIRMLQDQVASAEDIDRAMSLGYKHPIGPLQLTDLVGLDVRLGVARHLAETIGPRFEPPDLLVDMVEQGRLGRKAGKGFYDWPERSSAGRP